MKIFPFNSGRLDEILFEHRNKEYGAYQLRKSYSSTLIRSFIFSLTLLVLFFGVPFLVQYLSKKPVPVSIVFKSDKIEIGKKYDLKQKIEIKKTSRQSFRKNVVADAPYEVKKDSLITQTEIKKDSLQNNISAATHADDAGSDTTGNNKDPEIKKEGSGILASALPMSMATVDNPPHFPGGDQKLISFLQDHIHYNETAKHAGITGRVYASFIINHKGEVESIKIIRSLGYGLDEEVVRVLEMMPPWEPGTYKGNKVSTVLNIPVSFSLMQ
ncbi:MAG: energy transducer TonB [Bacteroidetes bacterium]|nr:energy transducer TonB [Bacteroidota bacterium]